MGILIDRGNAREVFQRALRLAHSEVELPEEWLRRTDRVGASKSKTLTPLLGNALLAKATNRHVDALSLREDEGHKGYSARSLAKDVFVPSCMIAGIDIRTTGAEPLNNQPFLRAARISPDLKVKKGTEEQLAYLCESVAKADFLENEDALQALAAFLRTRIRATGELGKVAILGTPVSADRLVESAAKFVSNHSDGGRVGQALVAATLDLVFKDVRTRRVNDPSRGWPGDVGAFIDKKLSVSVEVKQRPFTESEIIQFVDRLAEKDISRGRVAALNQGSTELDVDDLVASANSRGVHLDVILGMNLMLSEAIRYMQQDPVDGLPLFPQLGLKRLKEIEASEEIQQAWVEATTE